MKNFQMESQFLRASELNNMISQQKEAINFDNILEISTKRISRMQNIRFSTRAVESIHILKLYLIHPQTKRQHIKHVHFELLSALNAFKQHISNPKRSEFIIPSNISQDFFHYDNKSIKFNPSTQCYRVSDHPTTNISNCQLSDQVFDSRMREAARNEDLIMELEQKIQEYQKINEKNEKMIKDLQEKLSKYQIQEAEERDETNFSTGTMRRQISKKITFSQRVHFQRNLQEANKKYEILLSKYRVAETENKRFKGNNCNTIGDAPL